MRRCRRCTGCAVRSAHSCRSASADGSCASSSPVTVIVQGSARKSPYVMYLVEPPARRVPPGRRATPIGAEPPLPVGVRR
eukprot:scaffold13878_cov66-Phaeocystis_antarctica.AAC.2